MEWDATGIVNGNYEVAGVARDAAGNEGSASANVTIEHDSGLDVSDVQMTNPTAGVSVCGTVVVEAAVSDAVETVMFALDGATEATDEAAPFSWEWDTTAVSNGVHTLRATGFTEEGLGAQHTVSVNVENTDTPCDNRPSVRFTSPEDSTFGRGVVEVSASASDDQGVLKIQFFVDNGLLLEDESVPYGLDWDTDEFDEGPHTLEAVAFDTAGQSSETRITFSVDRTSPTVAITSHAEGDTIRGTEVIDVDVADESELAWVTLQVDGVDIETLTEAPFSWGLDTSVLAWGPHGALGDCDSSVYVAGSWGTLGVSSGTYVLSATATNAAGETATTSVSVTLDADADGDGYDATAWGGDDCDDDDATVSPGATELAIGTCDSVDNDCDGAVDEDFDADGDGAASAATCPGDEDCDDADATIYPGAPEVCGDGIDQDYSTASVCGDTGTVDLADANAKITGEDTLDSLGGRVWTADVNDDGSPDVLTSAYSDDDAGSAAGAVYAVFGPTFADLDASAADAKIVGEGADDYVLAIGSGDMDGDGVTDLLVGAWGEGRGGASAGAVYLLSGPITGDGDLSTADAKVYGEDSSDYLGYAVHGADLDDDGLDDIVMGAHTEDEGGTDAGAAYIVYGSVSGTSDVATADAKLIGEGAGDAAGRSLTAADFDGDGADDLLVGADYEDSGGTYAGAVYLLLGAPSGDVDLSTADAKLLGESAYDSAGWAMTTGDPRRTRS
ncbi:MAG: Ig-like domain-containing protein [Pseudomonadota bacterium]|nr:Ig-like domain-containing protein [Pseudomonadota bacterium]